VIALVKGSGQLRGTLARGALALGCVASFGVIALLIAAALAQRYTRASGAVSLGRVTAGAGSGHVFASYRSPRPRSVGPPVRSESGLTPTQVRWQRLRNAPAYAAWTDTLPPFAAWNCPGFVVIRSPNVSREGNYYACDEVIYQVSTSDVLVIAAASLLPLCVPVRIVIRRRLQRRRARAGRCPGCAYDLRAGHSSGHCPECGFECGVPRGSDRADATLAAAA
jgi:hypothetical protein